MKDVYSAAKKLKMERVKQVWFSHLWKSFLPSQADSIAPFGVSEPKPDASVEEVPSTKLL